MQFFFFIKTELLDFLMGNLAIRASFLPLIHWKGIVQSILLVKYMH